MTHLTLFSALIVTLSLSFAFSSGATSAAPKKAPVHLVNNVETNFEDKTLTRFPEFPRPENIVNLNLEGNAIAQIPAYINRLVNLVELDVSENQIASLPNEISALKKLKIIDLDNNQLEALPDGISDLMALEQLEVKNNRLKALPARFGGLHHLRELNLDGNQLTTLPSTFGMLRSLSILTLSNNKFKMLPKQITALNLTVLDLSGNTELIESSTDPNFLGKKELRAHFGDKVKLP